jgi:hypothetical protein
VLIRFLIGVALIQQSAAALDLIYPPYPAKESFAMSAADIFHLSPFYMKMWEVVNI